MNIKTPLWVSCALMSAGCGELASDDFRDPPFAKIRGQLVLADQPLMQEPISIAIQWGATPDAEIVMAPRGVAIDWSTYYQDDCTVLTPEAFPDDGTPATGEHFCHQVTVRPRELLDVVEYEASLPVNFEIQLNNLPPAAARVDLAKYGGTGTFAMGTLIAFIDQDQNGDLDRGTPTKSHEPGLAESVYQNYVPASGPRVSLFIAYLDGQPNLDGLFHPETVAQLPQGFSFWVKEETFRGVPSVDPVSITRRIDPITTPIVLSQHPGIEDDWSWCSESELTVRYVGGPTDNNLQYCWFEGRVTEWRSFDQPVGLCKKLVEIYHADTRGLALEDLPSDWPCTLGM